MAPPRHPHIPRLRTFRPLLAATVLATAALVGCASPPRDLTIANDSSTEVKLALWTGDSAEPPLLPDRATTFRLQPGEVVYPSLSDSARLQIVARNAAGKPGLILLATSKDQPESSTIPLTGTPPFQARVLGVQGNVVTTQVPLVQTRPPINEVVGRPPSPNTRRPN